MNKVEPASFGLSVRIFSDELAAGEDDE